MNPMIPLGVNPINFSGAFAQGQEMQTQNALRQALQQHGAAAMSGDQNALRAIAQYDPGMAQELMSGQLGMEGKRLDMDLAKSHDARQAQTAQHGMRMDDERLKLAQEEGRMRAQQFASQASAEQAEKARAEIERAAETGMVAHANGPEAWDKWNDSFPEYKNVPFEEAQVALAAVLGAREGLMPNASPRASLNPIWGTNADGQPAVMQLSESGAAVPTEFPEGFTPGTGTDRIDAGTEWILLDPVTRQPVGRVPKNNFEAASESAQGRAVGEDIGAAKATLPQRHADLERIESAAAEILNDPVLPSILGPIDSRRPRVMTDGADAQAKIETFRTQTFPMAMQSLRGLGPASEMEGIAAQKAIANLDQARSPEEFERVLNEAVGHLRRGFEIAQQKAGQTVTEPNVTGDDIDSVLERYR
jgi:hypothetical protein